MNIYLTSAVKLDTMTFYSGTSTQTPHSAPTCSAIQMLVDTYLNGIQTKCALITH